LPRVRPQKGRLRLNLLSCDSARNIDPLSLGLVPGVHYFGSSD